jgi:hypothetical protein
VWLDEARCCARRTLRQKHNDVVYTISRPPASRPGHHMVEAIPCLVCLLRCIERRLGLLQLGGIKFLGEPAVDQC